MFRKLIVSLCLIAAVYGDNNCANVKCSVPKHYKELGCTPVTENDGCCPSRYECPDKSSFEIDKCYWQGKAINIGEQIPNEETESLCSASCRCAEGYPAGQPAKFRCAHIECAHLLNTELLQCQPQYTFGGCCPYKYLCKEDEIKSLGAPICHIDGGSHRIGENFYPASEPCYKCLCTENFNNSTIIGNPACKEINCGIELRHLGDFLNGCIPEYHETGRCCPIQWRCPKVDTDEFLPSESRTSDPADPKDQCIFGNIELHVDDEIKTNSNCVECKCVTPPLAHCVKKRNCYN